MSCHECLGGRDRLRAYKKIVRQFGRIGGEDLESAEKVLNRQEASESADAKPPELCSGTEQLRADPSILEVRISQSRSES